MALMIPMVTVSPSPNGLPIARTMSPTSIFSESPICARGSEALLMRRTARSVRRSAPTMRALSSRPSASDAFTSRACSMTW